jgi:hypothetical protein
MPALRSTPSSRAIPTETRIRAGTDEVSVVVHPLHAYHRASMPALGLRDPVDAAILLWHG